MQLALHHIDYLGEVVLAAGKIDVIGIDDEQSTAAVAVDPAFVFFVEAAEVVQADAALVITAPHLDVVYQRWDAGTQVNEEIWWLDLGRHGFEQIQVIVVVSPSHQAHVVQVAGKNVSIFVNGPILNDRFFSTQDRQNLLVSAVQKVNLQVERPTVHVVVKINEVRVVVGGFIVDVPIETFAQLGTKGCFSGANISGNGHVLDFGDLVLLIHTLF